MNDITSHGLNFIALDVETANNRLMSSICQIGLCVVINGEIAETKSYLVNPECNFTNSHIHGISSTTVADSPAFPDVLTEIQDLLEGKLIVHHGHFDRKALAATSEQFRIALPNSYYLDSTQFFKKTFSRYAERGYGLKNLCQDFSVAQTSHHSAGNDAQCLSQVFVLALIEAGLDISDLQSWKDTKGEAPGITIVNVPSLAKPAQQKTSETPRATRPVKPKMEVSPGNPFYRQTIVFTGEFTQPRLDLIEMAAAVGLSQRSSVSKTTTYLVIGNPTENIPAYTKPSQKRQKAEELNAQGANIQFLTERDFIALIDREEGNRKEADRASTLTWQAQEKETRQMLDIKPKTDPVQGSYPSLRSE